MSKSEFVLFQDGLWEQSIKRVVKDGWVGGGWSRSRFTENKTVLSQFPKNKIGISRFTEKRRTVFFKQQLYRYVLKNYVQNKAFLVVDTFYPLRVLRDTKTIKIWNLCGLWQKTENGISPCESVFFCYLRLKKIINTVTIWSSRTSRWWDLMHFRHYGRNRRNKAWNDCWP